MSWIKKNSGIRVGRQGDGMTVKTVGQKAMLGEYWVNMEEL